MALDVTKLTVTTIPSVSELMNWNDKFQSAKFTAEHRIWAFRGQPQLFQNLAPSFSRAVSSSAHAAAELIERELINDFRKHYAVLPDRSSDMPQPGDIGPGSDLKCLSVMQHYEVPTRLLDWTSDFWTALYFACGTDPGADAELWLYDRQLLASKGFDRANELASIGARIGSNSEPANFALRSEKILAELDPRLTPRMKQQLAHHTVAANVFDDHAQLLSDLATQANEEKPDEWYFRRFVIQSACKPKVLKFLADHKKITASTIFPDVVGLGRFLRWQFESLRTMLT